jgi:hypothetical protein
VLFVILRKDRSHYNAIAFKILYSWMSSLSQNFAYFVLPFAKTEPYIKPHHIRNVISHGFFTDK